MEKTEQQILIEMLQFKQEIESKLSEGMTLRQISQWSYNQRESGRDIPYFAITQTAGKDATVIWASPTYKQKELYSFFSIYATNSVLNRYTLYVDAEEGVVFKVRKGKGKENVEYL